MGAARPAGPVEHAGVVDEIVVAFEKDVLDAAALTTPMEELLPRLHHSAPPRCGSIKASVTDGAEAREPDASSRARRPFGPRARR
jgi:hypothetical protein